MKCRLIISCTFGARYYFCRNVERLRENIVTKTNVKFWQQLSETGLVILTISIYTCLICPTLVRTVTYLDISGHVHCPYSECIELDIFFSESSGNHFGRYPGKIKIAGIQKLRLTFPKLYSLFSDNSKLNLVLSLSTFMHPGGSVLAICHPPI